MSSDRVTLNPGTPAPATRSTGSRPQASVMKVNAPAQAAATPTVQAAAPATPSVQEVASRIESYLKDVNRALEFRVDAASGRTVVTVRDAESGDLIRQIPNEEVLRFAQLAEEQTIVLLNENV